MNVHRTWFKILLNPILRKLGWVIVSNMEDKDGKWKCIGYGFRRYRDGKII